MLSSFRELCALLENVYTGTISSVSTSPVVGCTYFLFSLELFKAIFVSLDAGGDSVERIVNYNSFSGEPTPTFEIKGVPISSFEVEGNMSCNICTTIHFYYFSFVDRI
ncbi:hypothetical protein AVEN_144175-1 [Araneus ventricosus]|uniref:Uncharacterized protein n=1 Tax=Araneus ventricosus TaxID=182803 RepID=A0A4Y2GDA5_ARAVE|nr:hypothetical protein AVEN_144175-1 [Araneus ventricosus]